MNTNTDFDKIDKVLSKITGKVIKDGIKKMIAEYPDKYYVKNYLGSVL